MKMIGLAQYPSALSKHEAVEVIKDVLEQAAVKTIELVVFGECWFGGYPAWIDVCQEVGIWDSDPVKKEWARMFENGLELEGVEHKLIAKACKSTGVSLALGCNEVVRKGPGNSTMYNSIVIIDSKGELALHHRKLVPTYNEKLLYGQGDARGLTTTTINDWSIGGLVCWEHWMPLSRFALHQAGEDIHLALWPDLKERHLLASRHYAFEGRCIVLAVGQLSPSQSIPADLTSNQPLDKKLLNGGSCVIGPDGAFLLEPQYGKEGLFELVLPPKKDLIAERMNLSVAGHYFREDLFEFVVKREM